MWIYTLTWCDDGIPDLEERFLTGTTIALLAPAVLDAWMVDSYYWCYRMHIQAKDVVISEIMWGLDEAEFGIGTNQQWIELYNSTTTSATDPEYSAVVNMGGLVDSLFC